MIGLDRGAAKEAFADFLEVTMLTGNQVEFSDMIANHFAEHGVMGAAPLYDSPFTDVAPQAQTTCLLPDDLYISEKLDRLVAVLDRVRAATVAASGAVLFRFRANVCRCLLGDGVTPNISYSESAVLWR